MMFRRPGARFNRGRVATQPQITPRTILGSLAWWVRSDLGITIGTGVSAWADQSGNGVNFTQASASLQPALIAGALNGRPVVRSDGVDDYMTATWPRVSPGTQPFYIWAVMSQLAWTGGFIGDFSAAGFMLRPNGGVSPQLQQFNGTYVNLNGGATLGSYFRVEAQFTNSTSDYFKIGSTLASGGNAGNGAGSGTLSLFSFIPGSGFGQFAFAEIFAFLGTPTAGQRSALDNYCTNLYGAGLV